MQGLGDVSVRNDTFFLYTGYIIKIIYNIRIFLFIFYCKTQYRRKFVTSDRGDIFRNCINTETGNRAENYSSKKFTTRATSNRGTKAGEQRPPWKQSRPEEKRHQRKPRPRPANRTDPLTEGRTPAGVIPPEEPETLTEYATRESRNAPPLYDAMT